MAFRADTSRVASDLESISAFGRVAPTAVTRLAFSPEDNAAHTHVEGLMGDAGLSTYYDAFGNLFGLRKGLDPSATPVMTGSHLDGPPNGGLYDGTAGVVCALEALRLIKEASVSTARPIEVVAIRAEHLDRFGLSCLGSRVMAGKLTAEDLSRLQDADGITLAEAVMQAGHRPRGIDSAVRGGRVHAFVELHVEQGCVLEDLGAKIGVVTGIAGPTRFHIRLVGLADHSGGTPMALRRDAFAGLAEVALELERMCRATASCVGTIGVVRVRPGAVHTIPGETEFWIDIRDIVAETKRALVADFLDFVRIAARRRRLEADIEVLVDEDPVPTSERVVASLCDTLDHLGVRYVRIPSGGGHDSQHLAAITDVGMLFVPSAAGTSHTPEEYTEPEDLALGAGVLAECLVDLAEVA